tara:strand:+ start:229 stop:408 length:180 start_codon:yes stop_codon:yes gene_type:complete
MEKATKHHTLAVEVSNNKLRKANLFMFLINFLVENQNQIEILKSTEEAGPRSKYGKVGG